jgi:hypothetical protein
VAGHDVTREPGKVRALIGLAGQHAAVDDDLTGRENLFILGLMHHLGRKVARDRAGALLDQFGLADAGDRLVKTWSGGMRRRLDVVASLIVSPQVLFLDEPTTGLDPRSRAEIRSAVRALADDGTTIYLGLLIGKEETAAQASILVFPVTMVSNVFVPTAGMPAWLRAIADWNPVSALAAASRLLFGTPEGPAGAWPLAHPVTASLAWTALLLAVFVPLATARYSRPG